VVGSCSAKCVSLNCAISFGANEIAQFRLTRFSGRSDLRPGAVHAQSPQKRRQLRPTAPGFRRGRFSRVPFAWYVFGMATTKITITLEDHQLAEVRALVAAGRQRAFLAS